MFTDEQGAGGSRIFPAIKQGDMKKLQAALATQSSLAQWVENALQMQQPSWKSRGEEVERNCAGNRQLPVVMEVSHAHASHACHNTKQGENCPSPG